MQEWSDRITETNKKFVLAGVLWIIGGVIFTLAAYKMYDPPLEPPCGDMDVDCPPPPCGIFGR